MEKKELNRLWSETLDHLKMQMTSATFNQILLGSVCEQIDPDGVMWVGVVSRVARDWAVNRLLHVILDMARAVFVDVEITAVHFKVFVQRVENQEERPLSAVFAGFEPFQTNWTQTPKQFFEVVLPVGPASVAAFVGAVINKTIGHIVNFNTGERREWWEASYSGIKEASGIKSKASIAKAIRLSVEQGYIVREGGKFDYRYRLRRVGEVIIAWDVPVDNPVDN